MRRLWFVRLLVALVVSVMFAGLAGSGSVLAANSASEILDSDGDRPLAGSTRYSTAALIAQEFVDYGFDEGGFTVTDAVVVSGESFPDALSAAALAGHLRAPILLTPPGALAGVVRSFISRNNIDDVHIVGGTAAVSQAVADAIDGLAGVSVTRISGADRYRTAVAVAVEVGGSTGVNLTEYCNTRDQTVLLANGQGFADALSGGPLAYSGPHPTLLTPPGGLPSSVLEYLNTARVERVIILGGTAVIPATIDRQLTSRDIQITRLAGADRFETAARVATALTIGPDDCDWLIQDYGLANGRSPYDALAGSALLGERQNPLLLTETNFLPAATATYLKNTPQQRDGEFTNIRLQVLGGTATVTQNVVNQAINQASTTNPLTAEIVATPGETQFTINFSSDVDDVTAESLNSYTVDGDPLLSGDVIDYFAADRNADNPKAHVEITLEGFRLRSGFVITVKPETIRAELHTQGDNRFVRATSFTIPRDNLRPRIIPHGVNGADRIYLRLSETPYDEDGNELFSFEVEIDRTGTSNDDTETARATGHDELLWETGLLVGANLRSGNRISVDSREIYDLSGNANSLTRDVVGSAAKPRLGELTASKFRHPSQASTVDISGLNGLAVATRSSGDFAGAAGNTWSVEFIGARQTKVFVTEGRKRVLFEIRSTDHGATDDSRVTTAELIRAADASRDFSENFQLVGRDDLDADDLDDSISPSFGISEPFSDGSTTATVLARWTQPVRVSEDSIEVCPGRCSSTAKIIPGNWDLSQRSASGGAVSELVEWTVDVTEDEDTTPTSSWSMIFDEGAATGVGDPDNDDNVRVERRIRVSN